MVPLSLVQTVQSTFYNIVNTYFTLTRTPLSTILAFKETLLGAAYGCVAEEQNIKGGDKVTL